MMRPGPRRLEFSTLLLILLGLGAACTATTPPATTSEGDTTGASSDATTGTATETSEGTTSEPGCEPGALICEGDSVVECGEDGEFSPPQACAVTCVDGVGCAECSPGESLCADGVSQVCQENGQWGPGTLCDPVQGLSCDEGTGLCAGACANLPPGHVGCEFYPTIVTSSIAASEAEFEFAVTIANNGIEDATARVEIGDVAIADVVVPPGGHELVTLPWVNNLTGVIDGSRIARESAFHLRSDMPVAVAQHHPIGPTSTADATVLLPTHAWGVDYRVPSYPGYQLDPMMTPNPGTFTVTGLVDGTEVTLAPPPGGTAVDPGDTTIAGSGGGSVVLNRGDILKVLADELADLHGVGVTATAPVQVIGGSMCSFVPEGVKFCDHLEAVATPKGAAGVEFIAAPPAHREDPSLDTEHLVRVTALVDDVDVTVTPGRAHSLAAAGEWFELDPSSDAYVISADKPVMVTQYSVGLEAHEGASDPSMMVTPALSHYRDAYAIVTVEEWPTTYAEIVAPGDATVEVDGAAVDGAAWTAVDGSSHVRGRVLLDGPGLHTVTADAPVGVTVYSCTPEDGATSYWTAGGYALPPGRG